MATITNDGNEQDEKLKEVDALAKLVEEGQEEKKQSCWSNITLEPMWFGVTVSMGISFIAFQNFFLERACTDLGHTYKACVNSTGYMRKSLELQSQMHVSLVTAGSTYVGGWLTCLALVFLGSWSDSTGRRKPLILLPLFGMIITSLTMLVLQFFPSISSAVSVYAMTIPMAIFGSSPLLMLGVFSYLGDICYKTGRCATNVMGSNNAAISAATIIGTLLAPIVLRKEGYCGAFSISFVLQISSYLYCYLKVKDTNIVKNTQKVKLLTLPTLAVRSLFKKREGYKRWNVMAMVFVPCTTIVTFSTETIILYFYLRHVFAWNEVDYGVFSTFRAISHFIGTVLIIKVLKNKYMLRDETIGMIGGFSNFMATIVLIFATESWVFLSPIVGVFGHGVLIAEKPVLNQQIESNEQGKLNSITAILDKVLTFGIVPLTHYVYYHTVEKSPNRFLFFGLLAAILQISCYLFVYRQPIKSSPDYLSVKK